MPEGERGTWRVMTKYLHAWYCTRAALLTARHPNRPSQTDLNSSLLVTRCRLTSNRSSV